MAGFPLRSRSPGRRGGGGQQGWAGGRLSKSPGPICGRSLPGRTAGPSRSLLPVQPGSPKQRLLWGAGFPLRALPRPRAVIGNQLLPKRGVGMGKLEGPELPSGVAALPGASQHCPAALIPVESRRERRSHVHARLERVGWPTALREGQGKGHAAPAGDAQSTDPRAVGVGPAPRPPLAREEGEGSGPALCPLLAPGQSSGKHWLQWALRAHRRAGAAHSG